MAGDRRAGPGSSADAAAGWLDHLRSGGATPWLAWRDQAAAAADRPTSPTRPLPGAQHLEVLRRLNALGPVPPGTAPDGAARAALADVVLDTDPAGRGQQARPLLGTEPGTLPAYGPPPADPATLPVEELLRVAVGALADRVLAAGPLAPAPVAPGAEPSSRRLDPRRLRRGYRLGGDPWLRRGYAGQLAARGRPPGGLRPRVVLLLADLPTLLGDRWAWAARHGDGPDWDGWLRRAARRPRLPPRADPLRAARDWRARVGRSRMRLALDAQDVAREVRTGPLRTPYRPSHAAVEVARRTAAVLRSVVEEPTRHRLVDEVLLPRLAAADPDGPGPAVPPDRADWVREQAVRLREGLLADGYRVADDGDRDRLDRLLPPGPVAAPGADRVPEHRVLEVTLRALRHPVSGARS